MAMNRLSAIAVALALPLAASAADFHANGKAIGMVGAPVIIQLFSDFQCPSCKMLHEGALRNLIADFVDRGKVYLEFREFPLPMHSYSRQAAYYADAAEKVGKYKEVADALFRQQPIWSNNGNVDAAACSVLNDAEARKVRALIKDPAIAAEVQKDVDAGNAAGIRQTPTMIVTYKMRRYPLAGAVNYDLLRQFLTDLLSK